MGSRNIVTALECFVHKDGKWLMLHRHPNKKVLPNVWMGPGGKIEQNEGLFECARREIFEETGLKVKNLKIKAVGNAYLKDVGTEMFFHFLTADYKSGKLRAETEVGELVWLKPAQIYKLDNLLTELHRALPHVFSNSDKIISYKAVYESGNTMTSFILESPR